MGSVEVVGRRSRVEGRGRPRLEAEDAIGSGGELGELGHGDAFVANGSFPQVREQRGPGLDIHGPAPFPDDRQVAGEIVFVDQFVGEFAQGEYGGFAEVERGGQLVRPDVVVHLPGGRHLVVDAKAPLSAFLAAQADGLTGPERAGQLGAHARALRAHVQDLAAKGYWTATADSPPLVVCFVPGEAILGAALAADPALHEDAMAAGVVLASPATLLAVLRTVAYAWQQEALADGARELLDVGRELYARIGALGRHAERLGAALLRSVTAYNGLVGSLESRVLVTARRMNELGLGPDPVATPRPVDEVPRALTAVELIEALDADVARPQLLEETSPRRQSEAG